MPGLIEKEQENQYEITVCIKDGETNECKQHGVGDHNEPYTLMNASISETTSDAYTLATDAESNSRRTSTISGQLSELSSANGRVNPRTYYSSVGPRRCDNLQSGTYTFANDAFAPNVRQQISIPPSIPEFSPSFFGSDSRQNSTKKRSKSSCTVATIVISLFAILTSIAALAIGVTLLNKVQLLQSGISNLQSRLGERIITVTAVTPTRIEPCYENSCHPIGGLCSATEEGHQCICKQGWSGNGINCTGVEVGDGAAEISYATCAHLRKVVGYNTGYYIISPDPGNVSPLLVRCVMERDKGVTEIDHDSEAQTYVNGCNPPGCYTRNITYLAKANQVEAVIAASSHCSQYIKYECYHSGLRNNAWWISSIGTKETYWDEGAVADSCACSKNNGTCPGCFCNMNDSKYRKDEGYITNKTLLPIMQLRYGDVGESWEDGYHTLGKLRCYD